MKEKRQYVVTVIAGLLLISLGIFCQLTGLANEIISLIFINAGTIMAVIGVIHYNKFGAGLTQDERTRKLGSRALSYSWLITFVMLNIIFWIDYLNIIKITLSQGLGIILFTMVLSAGILQWILKRKGIVNED
ncbi:MAG: hypothetical protein U9Q92_07580 [archaeon]|nr:hypothetical protein [archaeon]